MTKPIALLVGDGFDRTAQEVNLDSLGLARLTRVLVPAATAGDRVAYRSC